MNRDQADLDPDLDLIERTAFRSRITKLGVILAILALLASAGLYLWDRQGRPSEQEYLSRAHRFIAGGQLPAAVIELKNAIQANPRNGKTHFDLALAYLKLGLGQEAEEQLTRARELGADPRTLSLPLGEALLLQQKHDKALQVVTPSAYTLPAERQQAMRIHADALLGLGKADEACPIFRQSREADPKHVPAYWGLMKCAMVKKDFQTARAHLDTALKLEPRNLRSLMLKASLAQDMNDPAGAEAAYGEALALDPDSIPARIARAAVRLEAGKIDQAVEDVAAAKKRAPDILVVRYMEALIAYRQDRLTDAQNLILGVSGRAPDYQPGRLLSGWIAFQLGQYRLADKELSAVLLWQPGKRDVRLALAQSRLRTSQPEGALAVLEPLLAEKDPDADALLAAGDAYLQLGKPDKATAYLDKAARLAKDQAATRSKVGLLKLRAGDAPGASRDLEAAIQLGTTPLQAEALRIGTLLMRREFDQSLALALAMEKRYPKEAAPHQFKGMAYAGKNDLNAARRSLERAIEIQPANVATAKTLAQLDILQGKPDVARTRYEAVLKHDPGNYEAMMALAALAKAKGRESDYVDRLTRTASAAPGESAPRLLLARHFLEKKDPVKATPWAQQARDLNTKNPQAQELMGDVQLANGEKDNAVYSYLQWTLVAPDSAEAHFKLGRTQVAAGHTMSAKESLERALKLKPDHAPAAIALIQLAQGNGRHQDALRYATQLRLHHPNYWEGHALEGDSQEALGRHAEAAQAYGRAFSRQRSNKLFIRLHQALSRSGQHESAQRLRDDWLRVAPKDLGTRLYLGYSQLVAGRSREAQADFQVALEAEPNNVPALVGMSSALEAQGDARALQYAERAFKQSGRDADTSDHLGWMLLGRGDTQRALELLRRAEALAPESPRIRYHLAAVLAKSGDTAMARHLLETLLAKGNAFPERTDTETLLRTLPKAGKR